jgi:hypothetical protein
LQNGLNIALTLLNSFQIYKLLLDLATFVNGTSILFIACMASLFSNDTVNIIMAILGIANLAMAYFPTDQSYEPNYIAKRLRSNVTSTVSLIANRFIQSLNPILNGISNLIIGTSTRNHTKFRSRSTTGKPRKQRPIYSKTQTFTTAKLSNLPTRRSQPIQVEGDQYSQHRQVYHNRVTRKHQIHPQAILTTVVYGCHQPNSCSINKAVKVDEYSSSPN